MWPKGIYCNGHIMVDAEKMVSEEGRNRKGEKRWIGRKATTKQKKQTHKQTNMHTYIHTYIHTCKRRKKETNKKFRK